MSPTRGYVGSAVFNPVISGQSESPDANGLYLWSDYTIPAHHSKFTFELDSMDPNHQEPMVKIYRIYDDSFDVTELFSQTGDWGLAGGTINVTPGWKIAIMASIPPGNPKCLYNDWIGDYQTNTAPQYAQPTRSGSNGTVTLTPPSGYSVTPDIYIRFGGQAPGGGPYPWVKYGPGSSSFTPGTPIQAVCTGKGCRHSVVISFNA